MTFLALAMRWAHILAAVTAVGGILFMRFVLMPSAEAVLQVDQRQALRAAVAKRWQHWVHTCILLFLVSGLYNYLFITRFQHPDQPAYHMLFGIKFFLAMVVFVLALGLTSTRSWSEALRANAKMWLAVLAAVAVAIIAISGVLRSLPKAPPDAPGSVTQQAVTQALPGAEQSRA